MFQEYTLTLKKRRLIVWTSDDKLKVLTGLGHALKPFPTLEVAVVTALPPLDPAYEDVVFALGNKTVKVLQEQRVLPKNKSLTAFRQDLSLKLPDGRPLMFSYSPGIKEVSYESYVEFVCDGVSAARMAATGNVTPPTKHKKYKWVTDFSELIAEIEAEHAQTGKPVNVAFDTETQRSEPWSPDSRFVTLQFTRATGTAYVLFLPNMEAEREIKPGTTVYEQLRFLLQSPKILTRAASGKYDFLWLWVRFELECTNFKFDSTLVGNLLDENRSNSLDVHAKWYSKDMAGYSDVFDKSIDKGNMAALPKDDGLLFYAGGDTDACQQVSDAVRGEIMQDKRLTAFYAHILHPASRAFEVLERGGVCIDKEKFKELDADCTAVMKETAAKAIKLVGGRIAAKHYDADKVGTLDLTKASFIMDYMFSPMGLNLKPQMMTEKSGKPSTAWEHLQMFKGHPEAGEFIKLQTAYQEASKTKSTFSEGFMEHLRGDNRLHATYFLSKGRYDDDSEGGAVTGRLSAKKPPMQVVPKHTGWAKRIRRCFVAPDGHVILERDFNQGELRVVACIADEPTMIQAYKEGKDLHALTGSRIAGITYEQMMKLKTEDEARYDSYRQPAKPANFGLLYGQGTEGFMEFAELNYGVVLGFAAADKIRNVFFESYSRLLNFHRDMEGFAKRYGHVRSPLGRIRHLPLINSRAPGIASSMKRKAINSPVQSTLSDMMLWALALEWQQGLIYAAPPFAAIHDATYDYVPEDKVEEIAKRKIEIMENLPFERVGWRPQLKFTADAKVGKNLADLKSLKFKA